jgi:hypothetical protein
VVNLHKNVAKINVNIFKIVLFFEESELYNTIKLLITEQKSKTIPFVSIQNTAFWVSISERGTGSASNVLWKCWI